MDKIICPHCGKNVELSEAFVHQLSSKIVEEEKEKQKLEFEKQKEKERAEAEEKLRKEFEETSKTTKLQAEEAIKKQKELQDKLLEAEKLQKEREEKIRIETEKEISSKSRFEKLELEKKLSDTQKALEEAQRKSKQGSQQLQGEVLELELESKLKEAFPADEFVPIPKGVEGADIWQKVKLQGQITGSIIWETKRTKQWSNLWLTKLKEDASRVSASEAIIVSQVLPDESVSFDRKENVWVTNYEQAISIAKYVRFLINAIYKMKSSTSQTGEDWTKIRDYMLSDSFKHRMQAHFDAVKNLREMLETEKRTSALRWTRQQKQIDKLDNNTVNFYAELKDIISNLPELEELETPLLESENNESDQESLV